MPYAKKRSRKVRRVRTGRKRFTRRARRGRVSRPLKAIIPATMVVKTKYQKYFSFASGAATFATVAFRANGAYDPEAAVGGGVCSGWAELSAMYGKYRVLGCKMIVWGYNATATATLMSIFARNSTGTAPSSGTEIVNKALEFGGRDVKYARVLPYVNGNGLPKFRMNMYKSIKSMEGEHANIDQDYTAAVTSTPINQCYFDLNICAMDGTTQNTQVTANVIITYYVRFTQPNVVYGA